MTAVETITLDWSDVKAQLLSSIDCGEPWSQAKGADLLKMHRDPYSKDPFGLGESWLNGATGADVLRWLREGFTAPELQAAMDRVPPSTQIRPTWSDEDGDPDPGRLIGGYDEFFFAMGPRETKPGLKVKVDLFFSAGVASESIKAYGAWVAGVIRSLESQGYDLEIELVIPITALYVSGKGENFDRKHRADVRIIVKRFNELSDFTEWSVCFSPVGTRVVMFTAMGVASDSIGRQQTHHLGLSLPSKTRTWGAHYDAAENELRITADQRAWSADAIDRMTDVLKRESLL